MASANDRRRAQLRAVAERHGWELAGISTILWPRSPARLAVLREAWLEVEPDARAGVLVDGLEFCNFGAYGQYRPRAWWLWTRPDLERPDDRADEAAVLHAAGELSAVEIAALGVIA